MLKLKRITEGNFTFRATHTLFLLIFFFFFLRILSSPGSCVELFLSLSFSSDIVLLLLISLVCVYGHTLRTRLKSLQDAANTHTHTQICPPPTPSFEYKRMRQELQSAVNKCVCGWKRWILLPRFLFRLCSWRSRALFDRQNETEKKGEEEADSVAWRGGRIKKWQNSHRWLSVEAENQVEAEIVDCNTSGARNFFVKWKKSNRLIDSPFCFGKTDQNRK